jgi:ABC-type glycerol-3-phosphate transport system substrate-binding protein
MNRAIFTKIHPVIGKFAIVGLGFLLIFGCGRAVEDEDSDVVTVRFWHAMGGPLGEVLNEMIDEFNAGHPSIFVKSESMGSYEALKQKILASIVAKNQPDLAQAYEAWISTLLGGDALVDLGKLDPGFTEELEDFFPVLVENSYYDGRLMSLPFNKSVPVLYYNKDLFRRAGLDPEQPPRTWKEFSDYCRALTRDLTGDGKPNQWGFKFTDHATYFECLLVQNGGEIYDRENQTMLFASPKGVEALQYLVDLVRRERIADFYLTGYQHQVDFAAGETAMIVASCVSRTFMRKQLKFDWGIAPLPARERRGSLVYGTNIVIFSRSSERRREAAWEFIKWFTNPENSTRWALRTGYVPIRRSSLELEMMREEFARRPDSRVPVEEMEWAFFEPRMARWLQIREYLGDAIKAALLGKSPPGEALEEAVRQGELWLR